MRFLGTLGTRIIFQIGVMTPTALTHLDSAAFGKMGGGGEKCDLTCSYISCFGLYIYTHYMCVCDIDMQHTVNVGCFLFAVLACFSNSGFLVLLMFNYKSASQEELRFFWG